MTAIWEIINPSDKYTLSTDDHKLAALVICLIGEGKYGGDEVSGDRKVPLFLFGGHDEWFQANFGQTFEEALSTCDKGALADVFDTVLIGGIADRMSYEKGIELISAPEKRIEWRDHWHDNRRSSMNNIGVRAWNIAANLRRKIA